MVAVSRTLGIGETLLEPQVLNPPPTRHALFIFLIALAALLHVATDRAGATFTMKPMANTPALLAR